MIIALLYFYGLFLIVCGVLSVLFIGVKAKTALASGALSGLVSIVIAYLLSTSTPGASVAGLLLPFALFIVFAWRSAKTLFKIFETMSASKKEELNKKGIAFLIISLMAVVSIFVFVLQMVSLFSVA